jgi:hypothetical protein
MLQHSTIVPCAFAASHAVRPVRLPARFRASALGARVWNSKNLFRASAMGTGDRRLVWDTEQRLVGLCVKRDG